MWNQHWCPSATERVGMLALIINETLNIARNQGVLIIHAPSECTGWYKNYTARKWVVNLPNQQLPLPIVHSNPGFPIDSGDAGCDVPGYSQYTAWTHETDLITIWNHDAIIADNSQEIYNVLIAKGIKNIIYVGVHENMCVMNRQFSIEKTLSWGFQPVITREATDTMYDPSRAPYVPHDQGTFLMTEFIEKFWVPSVSIYDFLNPRNQTKHFVHK